MRNDAQRLADVHRYFDTDHAIVAATVEHHLPPLVATTRRLLDGIDD